MKKILFGLCIAVGLYACGGNDKKTTDATASNSAINNPAYQEGLALVVKSDCYSCHKTAEAYTGPAYEAIAAKYANTPENVTMLASKIINGGVGVWGQVPMSAHPTVSQADAEKMVKYILLLKK